MSVAGRTPSLNDATRVRSDRTRVPAVHANLVTASFRTPQPGGFIMLQRLALVALVLLASTVLHAQGPAWPTQSIRWIVAYPPGGNTHGAARVVVRKVAEQNGWTIV